MNNLRDDLHLGYPLPPWTYRGTKILNVVCRASEAQAVSASVAAPLRASGADGVFVLWFATTACIPELGSRSSLTEGGILIPVRSGQPGVCGATFTTMYVNNDTALVAGREIWGYPKKLATIRFDMDPAGHVDASVDSGITKDETGVKIFSAHAVLDDTRADLTALLLAFEPRLLTRRVPDPYAPRLQSEEVVKVSTTNLKIIEQRTGSAEAWFNAEAVGLADWGAIETLGAVYRVCDFVLPYAMRP